MKAWFQKRYIDSGAKDSEVSDIGWPSYQTHEIDTLRLDQKARLESYNAMTWRVSTCILYCIR